jgi:ribosomal protein S18 acetylase RimI-like enzyme
VPNDSSTSSVPVHRVVLRPAAPEDVAAVGDLTVRAYVHSGYVAADDEYVSQLRAADDRLRGAELWVATVGDTVSATVTVCPPGSVYRKLATPLEAELRMLAVDPSARRRGLATALVGRCLQRCTELGLDALVLCTLDQMAPALGLYTSLGFERDPDLDWEPAPARGPTGGVPGCRAGRAGRLVDWRRGPGSSERIESSAAHHRGESMSKTGRKRRARRKKKANHGKRPNT